MSTSPSLVLNQSELAALIGVSTKTVQQWDRAGLRDAARLKSSGRNAKYDVPAALRWWRDLEVQKALEPYSSTDLEDERRRLVAAQATRAELDLAREQGELIPVADAKRAWGFVLTRIRARIVAMQGSLPPTLVGMDTPREASAVVSQACRELLDEIRAVADEIEAEAPTAGADRP